MSAVPEQNSQSESDLLEAACDQAIAACDGNERSAIRALILANQYLEYEIAELKRAVSRGYQRGELTPRTSKADWYD